MKVIDAEKLREEGRLLSIESKKLLEEGFGLIEESKKLYKRRKLDELAVATNRINEIQLRVYEIKQRLKEIDAILELTNTKGDS